MDDVTSIRVRGWADDLRNAGRAVIILAALGALVLGNAFATTESCDFSTYRGVSCESETDGATFAVVAIAYFVSALVLFYPIYFGIARVLRSLAALLDQAPGDRVEADDD